jgi:hypothetical protein
MKEVQEIYGEGHWFERGAMKFFGTKLPSYAHKGLGGVYFVTSEQPPHGARAFSVRKLVGPGKIDTIGEFCSMTKAKADLMARRLAERADFGEVQS